MFILTSLHVSGNYVPIISRTYCIYVSVRVAVWSDAADRSAISLHVSGNYVPIISRTYCIYVSVRVAVWSDAADRSAIRTE